MQEKNSKAPWRAWMARCGAVALLALVTACGGGSGGGSPAPASSGSGSGTGGTGGTGSISTTPPNGFTPVAAAANVVSIVVDNGTDGSSVNSPYVTVTVCVPGSQTCQTIDHVLVDTGSYGLRIAASALTTVPASSLPVVNAPSGAPFGECAQFVSGYAWGSVRAADVKISGESASSVPIHVVNDTGTAYAATPSACVNQNGVPVANMGVGAGSKGILGVGFEKQDCGTTCSVSTAPNVYFACPATGCVSSLAPLTSQVTSPVSLFATDNNGVIVGFPSVALGGASSVTGQMIFGIGTQANNQLGANVVYTADSIGNFTTTYKGQTLQAFVDSGSNGIFFHDASITPCPSHSGFYCPNPALSLAATVTGVNGATSGVGFQVENPATWSGTTGVAHLGGDLGGFFDWGLPFFLGRTVFVAMRGAVTPTATTPSPVGPYWAF